MSRMPNKSLASLNPAVQSAFPDNGAIFRLSYAATHLASLGLDPNAVVECQGRFSLHQAPTALMLNDVDLEKGNSHDYERVSLSLAAAVCEMADVEHTRCLNALSIPFNKSSNQIPELGMLYELRVLFFFSELATNVATGQYLTSIMPSNGARQTSKTLCPTTSPLGFLS